MMNEIPPQAPTSLGTFQMCHDGPFVAGMRTSVRFQYRAGEAGLRRGGRLRFGVPNTGWQQPVPPQQRYWDELVQGADRRLAPFHPVNTTAAIEGSAGAVAVLDVMERMLVPDEDPALAYWRWWITATIEGADLAPGAIVSVIYGDSRFGSDGIQVQTFPEDRINAVAFVQPGPGEPFLMLDGSPAYFDVIGGPPSRANVVADSTHRGADVPVRVSITDACQAKPRPEAAVALHAGSARITCVPGQAQHIRVAASSLGNFRVRQDHMEALWGRPNPSVPVAADGMRLFWGDLHAQSEHHVMHSQKKDFRQQGWSKGISCGTLDECYCYGREIACLDFVAMTDQGACLTAAWEYCQGKVREYHQPGSYITFKAYEAGAPVGHRNVIYSSDDVEPPLDSKRFSNFHPPVLYDYYRERGDALLIPHHVKTWTDWQYHDPQLEPVMEIYSCWGQSEAPGMDLWNKGMTPGAGMWAAFGRGYRLGLTASSDNHVGMPGRSYPGDRQAHTPFKGGLCAIWAEELTRESLFSALRQRRCYGTTGARIIVRFTVDGQPMGSAVKPAGETARAAIEVHGTDEVRTVELISPSGAPRSLECARGSSRFQQTLDLPVIPAGFYYLRISQADGERAWSSPVFFEAL
jgi:Protein of unknown function (DUF3604)